MEVMLQWLLGHRLVEANSYGDLEVARHSSVDRGRASERRLYVLTTMSLWGLVAWGRCIRRLGIHCEVVGGLHVVHSVLGGSKRLCERTKKRRRRVLVGAMFGLYIRIRRWRHGNPAEQRRARLERRRRGQLEQ